MQLLVHCAQGRKSDGLGEHQRRRPLKADANKATQNLTVSVLKILLYILPCIKIINIFFLKYFKNLIFKLF